MQAISNQTCKSQIHLPKSNYCHLAIVCRNMQAQPRYHSTRHSPLAAQSQNDRKMDGLACEVLADNKFISEMQSNSKISEWVGA